MMNARRGMLATYVGSTLLLLATVGAGHAGSEDVTELLNILIEHSIPFDSNAVQQAAVEAILKTVDEGARILKPGQVPEGAVTNQLDITVEEWAEGIAYLKAPGLHAGTGTQVATRLQQWATAGRHGLILDIRGAAGSDLQAVVDIAGALAPTNTPLFEIRDGQGHAETHRTTPDGSGPIAVPVMLLIDQGTSSASELLAASVRNLGRVMIIGRPTSGDNKLRELLPLSNSNSLYVATRWLVAARGDDYAAVGVKPDITVADSEAHQSPPAAPEPHRDDRPLSEKAQRDRTLMRRVAEDATLARATDILLGLRALDEARTTH